MDTIQLAARNLKVTRHSGAGTKHEGIVVSLKVCHVDRHTNIRLGNEVDALLLQQLDAARNLIHRVINDKGSIECAG